MIGGIMPRPIALVSTRGNDGSSNVAPFSYFNGVGSNPPVLMVSMALSAKNDQRKDSLRNIQESGQFVIGLTTEDNVAAANQASFEYPYGESEFAAAGLTPIPARLVRPFLIAESPVNFECELLQVVSTGDNPGAGQVVLGRVLMVHLREDVLDPVRAAEGVHRIDPARLRAVGRMGGVEYVRTADRFSLPRPTAPERTAS